MARTVRDRVKQEELPEGVTLVRLSHWGGLLIDGPPAAVMAYIRDFIKGPTPGVYLAMGLLDGHVWAYGGRHKADDVTGRLVDSAGKPGCNRLLVFLGAPGKPLPAAVTIHCERWLIEGLSLCQLHLPHWNKKPGDRHRGGERKAQGYFVGMTILLDRLGVTPLVAAALAGWPLPDATPMRTTQPLLHLCGDDYSAYGYQTSRGFVLVSRAKLRTMHAQEKDVQQERRARAEQVRRNAVVLLDRGNVWGETTRSVLFTSSGPGNGVAIAEGFVRGSSRNGGGWKNLEGGCPRPECRIHD
jgi:hypothetical protein